MTKRPQMKDAIFEAAEVKFRRMELELKQQRFLNADYKVIFVPS